jgi:hypothetical protein
VIGMAIGTMMMKTMMAGKMTICSPPRPEA